MNQDPLSGLIDIHLPADIGWWPPALGWWFVFFLSLLVLFFIIRKLATYLKNIKYRREALVELRKIVVSHQDDGDGNRFLREVSVLLRRVAIHHFGRQEVADLTGDGWLSFLDRTGSSSDFTQGEGVVLGQGMYRGTVEVDPVVIFPIVEKWIRTHK